MQSRETQTATDAPVHGSRPGSRRCAMRVIQNGRELIAVYVVEPAQLGQPRALVFETPRVCTRLTDFPDDWNRLSQNDLLALGSERPFVQQS